MCNVYSIKNFSFDEGHIFMAGSILALTAAAVAICALGIAMFGPHSSSLLAEDVFVYSAYITGGTVALTLISSLAYKIIQACIQPTAAKKPSLQ
jgi:hypothetical protein